MNVKTKPSCRDETRFSVNTKKGLPAVFPICPHACIPSLCSTDITSVLHLKEAKLGNNEKCTELWEFVNFMKFPTQQPCEARAPMRSPNVRASSQKQGSSGRTLKYRGSVEHGNKKTRSKSFEASLLSVPLECSPKEREKSKPTLCV